MVGGGGGGYLGCRNMIRVSLESRYSGENG
jgi:hypothetical protein